MSRSVLVVSRFTPTFCAQTIMDTSFLWGRELEGELMRNHRDSYRNLDPEREFGNGDIFTKKRPAIRAVIGNVMWGLVAYLAAWIILKKRERV
jgi:hypothetical protein